MPEPVIHTIDLNFKERQGAIAVYLLPHAGGAALVECGPGSTLPRLLEGIQGYGMQLSDITDVFLTHIHLDHAGVAGWLARQGIRIHVHPKGAPHLLNPEKLLSSASRIYGDLMLPLWGEFLPVPQDKLSILEDGQVVSVGGLELRAVDVPGHALHHYAYIVGDACFSGDIGGVRIGGQPYISLPMPPPEFHLESWRQSILRLQRESLQRIVPTHFGVYTDPAWHLAQVLKILDDVQTWIESVLPSDPGLDSLRTQFIEFERQRAVSSGMLVSTADAQQIANPPFMSADGILRYWQKYRLNA